MMPQPVTRFVVVSMPSDYLPPWWLTLKQRRHGSKRLPRKLKKRLRNVYDVLRWWAEP